jgi:transposase
MVTLGVDAHKQVHAAVALDDAGRELGRWRGANSAAGWAELVEWASGFGAARRWGIEGAWSYGRGLAQHLVAVGEEVYEINPRWTAEQRRRSRRRDKTDALDARAVAMLVWREATDLPRVQPEDETAVLDLLVTEREGAVAEATRLRNQLHDLLLHLDPDYRRSLRTLESAKALAVLEQYTAPTTTALDEARAAAVRRLAQRLRLALAQAQELAKEIQLRTEQSFAPLTRLCGIGLLAAGALAGILGPGLRFTSDAQLAAYAGVSPLEASSAGCTRHRLNRGGNRRLNAILYRIAVTQLRLAPEAKAYVARRQREGKSRQEAIRALKRFIIRAVWRLWQECLSHRPSQTETTSKAVA